jgi:indole-3-glycerol phosphate synthase
MTVLDDIIAGVVEDLAERRSELPLAEVQAAVKTARPALDPLPALRGPGLAVIAEVKRSSPSKGALAAIEDPAALASAYVSGGAAAISVLTEQRRFGGSLDDLRAVRAAVAAPVLRKDFVVTAYQLWEARANGADLVLLIVAALRQDELAELSALASRLGMTALVETHTPDEVRRALAVGAQLIGVNNRNLKTLAVDLRHFEEMAAIIDDRAVKVAESGILSVADAERMRSAGADAILVGELLVRHGDPAAAVAALRSLA